MDDELDTKNTITQSFRRQIQENRFEFHFADNGLEALEKLTENPDISLVLLDWNMPVMDGLTFLDKFYENEGPYQKGVMVVMVTALNNHESVRDAMRRGAYDYLIKPLDLSEIEDMLDNIERTFERAKQARAAIQEHIDFSLLQADLRIAQDIQQKMLPKTFPPFPLRTDFDLHASLEAAKMVGGDLYDYFLMADGRLFFIIADVSDKGVQASMFMATTKAIVKSHFTSRSCGPLADEVMRINCFLSGENESGLFVTAFFGILDHTTGLVEYVDAGHEPPLILRKNNEVVWLKKQGTLALCIDRDFPYTSYTLQLAPGDTLFLYTDGLPDANNQTGARFKKERVMQLLTDATSAASPREIDEAAYQQVKAFIGEHAQFDDITLLTLRYNGQHPPEPQLPPAATRPEAAMATIAG